MTSSLRDGRVFYPQLDSLRAIAVMLVIISHWFSEKHFLNRYTANGSLGVTLFFVLSGFLITGILLNSKEKVETGGSVSKVFSVFYVRRALRIFPVYYLLLFVLLVFNMASVRESFPWHLFYASNFYFWRQGHFAGQLSHLWSLAVEEQFYLIWPAVIFCISRKNLQQVFLLGIVGAVLFRFLVTTPQNDLGRILMPGSLDSFCIGGLLAYGRQDSPEWYKWYTEQRSIFVVLGFLTLVFVHTAFFKAIGTRVSIALYFLLISAAFGVLIDRVADSVKSKLFRPVLENRGVLYVGKISYGIYLFHNFIPYFYGINLPRPLQPFSIYIVQLLRLALLLGIASLSWFLFEKPFLRLKARFEFKPLPVLGVAVVE
jgi:peptidoglycan/LPS O-acetylase OafA/YrhL